MIHHTLHELWHRNSNNSRSLKKRPYVLALLTSHLIGMEPGFSFLHELAKMQWLIRISAEESLFSHYTRNECIALTGNDNWVPFNRLSEKTLKQADIIFVPILSFSLASDILALNEQRPFVRMILNGLLTGKKVIAIKVGIDPNHQVWRLNGMDKGTQSLKKRLLEQMLKLKAMGIKLIDSEDHLSLFFETHQKKSVISAETIQYVSSQNQSKIIVTEESIITPLARDRAKELNITIMTV